MKGITQKDYKRLILNSVDAGGYENEYPLDTDLNKVKFLSETLRAEMQWKIDNTSLQNAATEWLQGLASACTIPFMNSDIIDWVENILGYELTEKQCDIFLDEYFQNAGSALVVLISAYERGQTKFI